MIGQGRTGTFPKWYMIWGRWWLVYWTLDLTFSLGVHVEPHCRPYNLKTGEHSSYGPYVDIHLPMFVISLGNNPVYMEAIDALRRYARGNIPVCPRCNQLTIDP